MLQRGNIVLHHGSWTLLYRDKQLRCSNGHKLREKCSCSKVPTLVRVRKTLASKSPEYPTEASVRLLAEKYLQPVNTKSVQPESSLMLDEFIRDRYLPQRKAKLKPSTHHGYEAIYETHLKELPELKIKLRDFRTVHGQRLLNSITGVSHTTMLHIKSMLSGVFKFAKREGVLDGLNPMMDTEVEGRKTKFKGAAYSLEEVFSMLECIEEKARQYFQTNKNGELEEIEGKGTREYADARDLITLLALTGLRSGEAQGLKWTDFDVNARTLTIHRSVWRTHVGDPKTAASEDTIPAIDLVCEMLERRRAIVKPEPDDYIFAGFKRLTRYGKRRAPLNLHNLENRVIKPALNVLGQTQVKWVGYHGFRRGLSTNLLALGVEPIVVAAIMRQSDVRTTLEHYNQQRFADKVSAMRTLEEKVRKVWAGPK